MPYEKNGQDELIYFPYSKDMGEYAVIREFALELTKDCTTDKEKIDTVYDWIVENIIYDDNAKFFFAWKSSRQKAKVNVLMFGINTDVEVEYVQIRKINVTESTPSEETQE